MARYEPGASVRAPAVSGSTSVGRSYVRFALIATELRRTPFRRVWVTDARGEAQLKHLGSGFVRYRLGVGPKEPKQMDMADFVLGKFTPDQQITVTQKLDHYVSGLELLLSRGIEPCWLNERDARLAVIGQNG